jgi:hypothetical protein
VTEKSSVAQVLQDHEIDEPSFAAMLQDALDLLFARLPDHTPIDPGQLDFVIRYAGVAPADEAEVHAAEVKSIIRNTLAHTTTLDATEAGEHLGVSPSRVRHRISERRLYALPSIRDGKRRLPRWQFTSDGVVPGLEQVLPVIPSSVHPLEVEEFFVRTNYGLQPLTGRDEHPSPRDWLISGGDPEVVADAARLLVERP